MSTKQNAYGVVTVIKEEEYKFLLLLQDKEVMNWSFPKGKAEEGEAPIQTAMRELEEETSITDLKILDFPLIEERYEFVKKDKTHSRVNQYFLGIVKDKSVKIQEGEILEHKWVTYAEALKTFVFKKETRIAVLKKAKEYLDHM